MPCGVTVLQAATSRQLARCAAPDDPEAERREHRFSLRPWRGAARAAQARARNRAWAALRPGPANRDCGPAVWALLAQSVPAIPSTHLLGGREQRPGKRFSVEGTITHGRAPHRDQNVVRKPRRMARPGALYRSMLARSEKPATVPQSQ